MSFILLLLLLLLLLLHTRDFRSERCVLDQQRSGNVVGALARWFVVESALHDRSSAATNGGRRKCHLDTSAIVVCRVGKCACDACGFVDK